MTATAGAGVVIDVRGLDKHFGALHAVKDLSLTVRRGEIFGFLGPNGSGKTTSIRMLCGLLTPDAGEGTCLGYDIRREARAIKRHVGYMTQRFSFWDDLTLAENLRFVARMYGLDRREERVASTLSDLGLASRADQLAGTLSGGWKQRLALAACLLHEPQLLLLDEPTAGVDPKARRDFWEELHDLAARGITVLVSTHYMDEAERCHKLGYILYGRLLVQGTAREVVAGQPLVAFEVGGDDLPALSARLRATPGVDQVAAFGATLHVTGADARLARSGDRPAARRGRVRVAGDRAGPGGRVHPPDARRRRRRRSARRGEGGVTNGFSFSRWLGILVKEFIQLQRDRLTFGMIVGIPVVQLVLFGFAINSDPKHLPTAVIDADRSEFSRLIVSRLAHDRLFRLHQAATDADGAARLLAHGAVQFVVTIPAGFSRALVRGERPSLMVEADATDPAATSNAIAALGRIAQTALDARARRTARAAGRRDGALRRRRAPDATTPRRSPSTTSCPA